jgi:hypothetical protein
MRALATACAAALLAACSIGALDGFSGTDVPDGGSVTPPAEGGTSAPDAPFDSTPANDATLPPTSPYHAAVAVDAPVAHFALEETAGAACASSTTTSAVCVYPPDKITRGQAGVGGTKAIHFDDTTANLVISGLPGDFTAAYSVELWIRVDNPAIGMPLGTWMNPSNGNGDGFNLFLWDDAQIRTETWLSGSLIAYGVAPNALTANVWHHVVIAHTPNPHTDLFYVDAQLVEHDTTNPTSRPQVTGPLQLFGFVGYVDEIAFYAKALTAERIAAHYALQ